MQRVFRNVGMNCLPITAAEKPRKYASLHPERPKRVLEQCGIYMTRSAIASSLSFLPSAGVASRYGVTVNEVCNPIW